MVRHRFSSRFSSRFCQWPATAQLLGSIVGDIFRVAAAIFAGLNNSKTTTEDDSHKMFVFIQVLFAGDAEFFQTIFYKVLYSTGIKFGGKFQEWMLRIVSTSSFIRYHEKRIVTLLQSTSMVNWHWYSFLTREMMKITCGKLWNFLTMIYSVRRLIITWKLVSGLRIGNIFGSFTVCGPINWWWLIVT